MLNIHDLPQNPTNNLKLGDGTWQYARVCELNTSSVFWNRASLITLSKDYATEASSALIYLLQKEIKTLGLWEQQWGIHIPVLGEFIKFLDVWGRFTNPLGYDIPIDEFWKSYNATIEGIIAEPSFEYNEEGLIQPYMQRLVKEEIQQVVCFDNKWNEQNFFIESSAEWMLFSWVTMA